MVAIVGFYFVNSSKSRIFKLKRRFLDLLARKGALAVNTSNMGKSWWLYLCIHVVETASACSMGAFVRLSLCEIVKKQDFKAKTAFSDPTNS